MYSKNYSKDLFEEMIRDWKANNSEYENLEISEPEINETGQWEAIARDEKATYQLTDDGRGNIVINYLSSR